MTTATATDTLPVDALGPITPFPEHHVEERPAPVTVDPRNLPAAFYAARKANEAGMWSRFIVGENPGKPDPKAAEQARKAEQMHRARKAESFERCDTDGFLSQWADGLTANQMSLAAEVAEQGGYSVDLGLFDTATGARIPAILVEGQWGMQWRLCDPATGRPLNEWVNDARGPRAALAKRGWVVLGEWAQSEARTVGVGTGLSGRAWAAIVRTDGGYPGRPRQGRRA